MSNQAIGLYGRLYVRINPDPGTGPDTLRLAITDSLGGDVAGAYSFAAEKPVELNKISGNVENVTYSMDFKDLTPRTD